MKYHNFIFDFDGTIVDTKDDIIINLQKVYFDLSIPFDIDRLVIGPPLHKIIKTLSPNISEELFNEISDRFRSFYRTEGFKNSFPYPDVMEMLESLKEQNYLLFIATNKPTEGTALLLNYLKMSSIFADTMSPNTFKDKIINKTEMLEFLIRKYQLKQSKTIMIGDTVGDILAGKNVGIDTAAHLKGYDDPESLVKTNPTFSFNSFPNYTTDLKDKRYWTIENIII